MKSTILKTVVGMGITLGFLSCSTQNNGERNKDKTILGQWELSQIGGMKSSSLSEAYPQGLPRLNFTSNKLVEGSDGCNSLNGEVSITKNEIKFKDLASTRMACQGVEDENFNTKINENLNYIVKDGNLLFTQGGAVVMSFVRPSRLSGTWELEELIDKNNKSKLLAERFPNQKPTVTFQGDEVTGNNGCNDLTGVYTVKGNKLDLKDVASTRMACQGVDFNAFQERFNNADKYEIVNGKLVLFTNNAKTLVFVRK